MGLKEVPFRKKVEEIQVPKYDRDETVRRFDEA